MADIDFGRISESLNNKCDRNMRNVDTGAKADSVIDYQEPTEGNGYTWYRKYISGWVEQGGIDNSGSGTKTITFPVTMQNSNYTVTTATQSSNATHGATVQNPTTTTVQLVKSNTTCYWQVCGMAA